jgi:hypothetical protein
MVAVRDEYFPETVETLAPEVGTLRGIRGERLGAVTRFVHAMRQRFPEAFAKLDEICRTNGIAARRRFLAELRVVEPLLEYEESAFVERHWSELERDGRLETFIRYGVERERMLLTGDPPLQRVQANEKLGPPHTRAAKPSRVKTRKA